MDLGKKSFALISWWVYASLRVWFNWSCGICWALIESDSLCRNGFFVVSYLLDLFLTFVLLFLFLGFQAPPPGKQSPDRDGTSDVDPDKKGLDSEMDMVGSSVRFTYSFDCHRLLEHWKLGYD
jgi:hypothetical protein